MDRGYPDPVPAPELPFETASWARRVGALLVDYAACWGVMLLIYGRSWFGSGTVPSIYFGDEIGVRFQPDLPEVEGRTDDRDGTFHGAQRYLGRGHGARLAPAALHFTTAAR